jgi:hypothetical protein
MAFWPAAVDAEASRGPQPVVSAYHEGFKSIVSGFLARAGVGWHVEHDHAGRLHPDHAADACQQR